MADRLQTTLVQRYPVAIDDGRGFLPDRIGFSAPVGMRDELHRVAAQAGVSAAAFARNAIVEKLSSYSSSPVEI